MGPPSARAIVELVAAAGVMRADLVKQRDVARKAKAAASQSKNIARHLHAEREALRASVAAVAGESAPEVRARLEEVLV